MCKCGKLFRSYSNVHSSLPPSTPRTPTPGGVPRSSTPKTGVRRERAVDDELPTTPRLPPRADHSSRYIRKTAMIGLVAAFP